MPAPEKPRPIRYDVDTWLVMRNDPVLPKAIIQRVRHRDGHDRYLLIRWDLDPARRQLMAVVDERGKADDLVLYDVPPSPVPPFVQPDRTVPTLDEPARPAR